MNIRFKFAFVYIFRCYRCQWFIQECVLC